MIKTCQKSSDIKIGEDINTSLKNQDTSMGEEGGLNMQALAYIQEAVTNLHEKVVQGYYLMGMVEVLFEMTLYVEIQLKHNKGVRDM